VRWQSDNKLGIDRITDLLNDIDKWVVPKKDIDINKSLNDWIEMSKDKSGDQVNRAIGIDE